MTVSNRTAGITGSEKSATEFEQTGAEHIRAEQVDPLQQSLGLAQQLASSLAIKPNDWHRLKANRQARALEQTAAALVFLLKNQPQEALVRLQQAVGWLDRSISAPPCPTHGHNRIAVEPASEKESVLASQPLQDVPSSSR
jgi:hypothetical protein